MQHESRCNMNQDATWIKMQRGSRCREDQDATGIKIQYGSRYNMDQDATRIKIPLRYLPTKTQDCIKDIFYINISPAQKQIDIILQCYRMGLHSPHSLLTLFGFSRKVNDLNETAAKLLEDDPLDLLHVLPLLLPLLRLRQEALAGCLNHLLTDERKRLSCTSKSWRRHFSQIENQQMSSYPDSPLSSPSKGVGACNSFERRLVLGLNHLSPKLSPCPGAPCCSSLFSTLNPPAGW